MNTREIPRKGNGQTLLLACGALAREVIEFVERNQWSCFTVQCLPADLHWHPHKIPGAVRDKIRRLRDRYDRIYVLYGDCGTSGELDRVLTEEGVERIPGPHCFSFFAGNEQYAADAEDDGVTTFYLTDFFVRHFDRFLWSGLGLDRHPELLSLYFCNYTKVVYIAQTDNSSLVQRARECADRLGLDFEYRFTGYGDFGRYIRIAAENSDTDIIDQKTAEGCGDENKSIDAFE